MESIVIETGFEPEVDAFVLDPVGYTPAPDGPWGGPWGPWGPWGPVPIPDPEPIPCPICDEIDLQGGPGLDAAVVIEAGFDLGL